MIKPVKSYKEFLNESNSGDYNECGDAARDCVILENYMSWFFTGDLSYEKIAYLMIVVGSQYRSPIFIEMGNFFSVPTSGIKILPFILLFEKLTLELNVPCEFKKNDYNDIRFTGIDITERGFEATLTNHALSESKKWIGEIPSKDFTQEELSNGIELCCRTALGNEGVYYSSDRGILNPTRAKDAYYSDFSDATWKKILLNTEPQNLPALLDLIPSTVPQTVKNAMKGYIKGKNYGV